MNRLAFSGVLVAPLLALTAGALPYGILSTDDGRVWHRDFTQGYIGAYDPGDGEFQEWKAPSDRSGPYAMATDDQGRIWWFGTDSNRLGQARLPD